MVPKSTLDLLKGFQKSKNKLRHPPPQINIQHKSLSEALRKVKHPPPKPTHRTQNLF